MTRKRKNKYNHYTEGFRREAVRRSEDPNTSAAEVAKEFRRLPVPFRHICHQSSCKEHWYCHERLSA